MTKFTLSEANFRRIRDFIPGLPFCDIMPLLKDKESFRETVKLFVEKVKENVPGGVDYVAAVELRGVPFAPALAYELGTGLVIVRKKGKLPGLTFSTKFIHDYAETELEVQQDCVEPGSKVLVVDDLLSTGGTLKAAVELLRRAKASVVGCFVVIEIPSAPGRANFERDLPGVQLHSLVKLTFEGRKPVYDPEDHEADVADFEAFLKGFWKDDSVVDTASKGALKA